MGDLYQYDENGKYIGKVSTEPPFDWSGCFWCCFIIFLIILASAR